MRVVRSHEDGRGGWINDVAPVRWMDWNNETGIAVRCALHDYLFVTKDDILSAFAVRTTHKQRLKLATTRKLPNAPIVTKMLRALE